MCSVKVQNFPTQVITVVTLKQEKLGIAVVEMPSKDDKLHGK